MWCGTNEFGQAGIGDNAGNNFDPLPQIRTRVAVLFTDRRGLYLLRAIARLRQDMNRACKRFFCRVKGHSA